MLQRFCLLLLASLLFAGGSLIAELSLAAEFKPESPRFAKTDWPWWRGPTGDGVAEAEQRPPLTWSATKNILWKAKVPGRGHASPTVVGARVFLPTADEQAEVQSVLCYDRASGRQLWKTDVHKGALERRGHKKSSQASATIACDGQLLFVNFLHDEAIFTTALDLAGKQVWQTRVSDFVTHQGFGSSPAIYQSLVLVSTDNKAGGVVAALDRTSGEVVWKHTRPKLPNYTSPAVFSIDGRQQLLLAGCDHVSSFDPLSGRLLWEIEGSTTECVGSIVTDGRRVFASGGYPKKLTQAVLADGSGKLAWENSVQTYVPSMLVYDGALYTVTDAGIAICFDAASGKELWKSRLGGTFNTSLVLVGDRIYAANQEGKTFVFRARNDKYEQLAENQLGDDVYATPAICGGRIYQRVAEQAGDVRQEWLYCIGSEAK
ncbi:MAG TPA: PQQ-binding-like beta-propeller repeat protein [Pirellulales bacterium]|nr:PQQ-binding-like beta-propeller repeat protein [Pirellulales bacterium]